MAADPRFIGAVHVTARVPEDLARKFQRVAEQAERTVSAELRRAMRAHIEDAKKAA